MSEKLGKGLEAIFGGDVDQLFNDIQNGNVAGAHLSDIRQIPVDEIMPNPHQPRKEFDEAALKELSESIATHGVFNPVAVVKSINGYVLVMGERRLRATKLAGLKEIPAYVVEYDDRQMMELSLLENTQREDLNIIEVASAYRNLIDKYNYTQEELAKRVGKSRESVTNTLRLLKLPAKIQEHVVKGQLSNGHVRAILSLGKEEDQLLIAKQAINEHLSVRALEALIKQIQTPQSKTKKPADKQQDKTLVVVTRLIQDRYQTKVSVNEHQIIINYDGIDDLNRILEIMGCLENE